MNKQEVKNEFDNLIRRLILMPYKAYNDEITEYLSSRWEIVIDCFKNINKAYKDERHVAIQNQYVLLKQAVDDGHMPLHTWLYLWDEFLYSVAAMYKIVIGESEWLTELCYKANEIKQYWKERDY